MRTTDVDTQGDHARTAHHAARRTLPVAAAIAALVGAGAFWAATRIEDDLTTRSRAALLAAGIPATVRYQGLDAVLGGTVADAGQAADAIGVVAGIAGTRHVTSRLSIAATAATPPSGTDDPAGTPTSPTTRLPGGSITFATGSTTLSAPAKAYLDTVAAFLLAHPQLRLAVRGHSDDVGPDELNWRLSRQRAVTVARYLEAHQVPGARLQVEAFAATSPVASNDTPEGRAANRRVELAIEETP